MLIPFGTLAASGAAPIGDYELISTTLISSNTPSVTFDVSSFASTYKHLQIRGASKSNHAATWEVGRISLNGDFAGNYSSHNLYGTGSTVGSNGEVNGSSGYFTTSGATTANDFGAQVIDFLDAYSTTKNKTFRTLSGSRAASEIRLSSGAWRNTSAITSITLWTFGGTAWVSGSRFSIYGIKG